MKPQRTTTVISTAIANGAKVVTKTVTATGAHRHRGIQWLCLEFAALVVYEIGRGIGHAIKEILLGRQP